MDREKWAFINKYADKFIDITNHYDDFTTSDLQGAIEAQLLKIYTELKGE